MNDLPHPLLQWPALADLPEAEGARVLAQAPAFEASSGSLLFDVGLVCESLPLLTHGTVRVVRRSDGGREIALYRVQPGDLCIVTLSCLLGGDAYPATGIAEGHVKGYLLPRALFLELLDHHPPFRGAAFALFAGRLTELMQLVEEISFRRLDQRLARILANRAPRLTVSHQGLADELGSVREIISRLLKQFEARGWVALGRNHIEVRNAAALVDYADDPVCNQSH